MPNSRVCRQCGWRFAQTGLEGCCVTCARELGLEVACVRVREQKRVAALQTRLAGLQRVQPVERVNPIRVVDGIVYEVVFDGSIR